MFISGLVLWQTEGNSALIALFVLGLLVFIPGFYFTRYVGRSAAASLRSLPTGVSPLSSKTLHSSLCMFMLA
jgi:hypothetical protein